MLFYRLLQTKKPSCLCQLDLLSKDFVFLYQLFVELDSLDHGALSVVFVVRVVVDLGTLLVINCRKLLNSLLSSEQFLRVLILLNLERIHQASINC